MTSSDLTPTEPTVEVKKNPCERELFVDVPAEEVTREWQSVVARLQKQARVPGFRSGKVPATLIRSKFAEEIKSEVVEHLMPVALRAECEKQNLLPVGQPHVVVLDLDEEKPLRFKAIFEVLPPFEVDGYKDIKMPHEAVEVTDEEVQKAIDNLREENATYVNVDEDRGLADGDFASVAFKSLSQNEGAEPVEMNDVLIDVGGADTLPEFTDNLRGAKAGETRSFDVTYAEDFGGDKRLAGKTLHYDVEVKGIKTKTVPEANDEWVKDLGQEGMETLDELRTRIREGMEFEKRRQVEYRIKEELMSALATKFPIDVPTLMVEHSIDQRLEHGLRSLISQGLRPEDIKRMNLNKLREGQHDAAQRDVRSKLLLEKIADLEGITVSDDDLDQEISLAAKQTKQNPLTMRKELEERGDLEGLRLQMRCDRALEWLYKHSE